MFNQHLPEPHMGTDYDIGVAKAAAEILKQNLSVGSIFHITFLYHYLCSLQFQRFPTKPASFVLIQVARKLL